MLHCVKGILCAAQKYFEHIYSVELRLNKSLCL
jgi:hypothetical protein